MTAIRNKRIASRSIIAHIFFQKLTINVDYGHLSVETNAACLVCILVTMASLLVISCSVYCVLTYRTLNKFRLSPSWTFWRYNFAAKLLEWESNWTEVPLNYSEVFFALTNLGHVRKHVHSELLLYDNSLHLCKKIFHFGEIQATF